MSDEKVEIKVLPSDQDQVLSEEAHLSEDGDPDFEDPSPNIVTEASGADTVPTIPVEPASPEQTGEQKDLLNDGSPEVKSASNNSDTSSPSSQSEEALESASASVTEVKQEPVEDQTVAGAVIDVDSKAIVVTPADSLESHELFDFESAAATAGSSQQALEIESTNVSVVLDPTDKPQRSNSTSGASINSYHSSHEAHAQSDSALEESSVMVESQVTAQGSPQTVVPTQPSPVSVELDKEAEEVCRVEPLPPALDDIAITKKSEGREASDSSDATTIVATVAQDQTRAKPTIIIQAPTPEPSATRSALVESSGGKSALVLEVGDSVSVQPSMLCRSIRALTPKQKNVTTQETSKTVKISPDTGLLSESNNQNQTGDVLSREGPDSKPRKSKCSCFGLRQHSHGEQAPRELECWPSGTRIEVDGSPQKARELQARTRDKFRVKILRERALAILLGRKTAGVVYLMLERQRAKPRYWHKERNASRAVETSDGTMSPLYPAERARASTEGLLNIRRAETGEGGPEVLVCHDNDLHIEGAPSNKLGRGRALARCFCCEGSLSARPGQIPRAQSQDGTNAAQEDASETKVEEALRRMTPYDISEYIDHRNNLWRGKNTGVAVGSTRGYGASRTAEDDSALPRSTHMAGTIGPSDQNLFRRASNRSEHLLPRRRRPTAANPGIATIRKHEGTVPKTSRYRRGLPMKNRIADRWHTKENQIEQLSARYTGQSGLRRMSSEEPLELAILQRRNSRLHGIDPDEDLPPAQRGLPEKELNKYNQRRRESRST